MPTNDNDPPSGAVSAFPADAHGAAALLLVESLIHALCQKTIFNTSEAVEIVERAVDVQFDQAEAADGEGAPLWHSHSLLLAIAASLRIDESAGPLPPPNLTR